MSKDPNTSLEDSGSAQWRRQLATSTLVDTEEPTSDRPVRVLGLTVLAHPDMNRVGEQAPLLRAEAGHREALSRLAPIFAHPRTSTEPRPLADAHLSRRPLWLCGLGDGDVELSADNEGAGRFVSVQGRPLDEGRRLSSQDVDEGVVIVLAKRIALLLHRFDPTPDVTLPRLGLIGESEALNRLRQSIVKVALSDVPVLILGETGSGKELVAQAIHHRSARKSGPLVSVNMASIPPALGASELFGATRGAFTGAGRRQGHFRRAEGGTLFLDEIGEAPIEVQALLLRALETREIQPLGSDQSIPVNVRIVAATDADLEDQIGTGAFKGPLFYRLNSAVVRLPTLRQRRDDIARLACHFLRQELETCNRAHLLTTEDRHQRPWFPALLMAQWVQRPWPGNVRQLRNLARQTVVEHGDREGVDEEPETEPFMDAFSAQAPSSNAKNKPKGQRSPQPSQLSESDVRQALARHRWRLKPAAEQLGISRTSLYALIDKYPGLRRAGDLQEEEIRSALERCDGDMEALVDELEVSHQGLLQRMRELNIW